MENQCFICKLNLTEEELQYYPSVGEQILLCKKHWCNCLPGETPWRWVNRCDLCEKNIICKSCYSISGNDIVCKKCCFKKGKLEEDDKSDD